ncbi:MAG: hypothetical protein ACQEQV_04115 [Fibrobacterota bacterium]
MKMNKKKDIHRDVDTEGTQGFSFVPEHGQHRHYEPPLDEVYRILSVKYRASLNKLAE